MGSRLFPFLADPANTADEDFSLITMGVNCVDRWLAAHPKVGH